MRAYLRSLEACKDYNSNGRSITLAHILKCRHLPLLIHSHVEGNDSCKFRGCEERGAAFPSSSSLPLHRCLHIPRPVPPHILIFISVRSSFHLKHLSCLDFSLISSSCFIFYFSHCILSLTFSYANVLSSPCYFPNNIPSFTPHNCTPPLSQSIVLFPPSYSLPLNVFFPSNLPPRILHIIPATPFLSSPQQSSLPSLLYRPLES